MKSYLLMTSLYLLCGPSALSEVVKVLNPASVQSTPGASENFSGRASITPILNSDDSSSLSSASVTFEPFGRTAWHSHPKGQLLIVTEGNGFVQRSGGPVQKIKKGDSVWTPPGVKHWHGATTTSPMTHVAIQEFDSGKNVTWLEKVSDEEYKKASQ